MASNLEYLFYLPTIVILVTSKTSALLKYNFTDLTESVCSRSLLAGNDTINFLINVDTREVADIADRMFILIAVSPTEDQKTKLCDLKFENVCSQQDELGCFCESFNDQVYSFRFKAKASASFSRSKVWINVDKMSRVHTIPEINEDYCSKVEDFLVEENTFISLLLAFIALVSIGAFCLVFCYMNRMFCFRGNSGSDRGSRLSFADIRSPDGDPLPPPSPVSSTSLARRMTNSMMPRLSSIKKFRFSHQSGVYVETTV